MAYAKNRSWNICNNLGNGQAPIYFHFKIKIYFQGYGGALPIILSLYISANLRTFSSI